MTRDSHMALTLYYRAISANMLDVQIEESRVGETCTFYIYSLLFRSGKIFRNMGNQYLGLFLGNVVDYIIIIGLFRKYIFLER